MNLDSRSIQHQTANTLNKDSVKIAQYQNLTRLRRVLITPVSNRECRHCLTPSFSTINLIYFPFAVFKYMQPVDEVTSRRRDRPRRFVLHVP